MAQHTDYEHVTREIDRSSLVSHDISHPNLFYASQSWAQSQTLHVAAVYNNPCRWDRRRELFNDFRRHMAGLPNIRLYVGELAYGDRPFEVTNGNHPYDFQFRTRDELWHKENLLNCVIARFSPDWEYGAYVDGDCHFTRHDIGLETLQELQHYDWVQMYSSYCDLCPDHRPLRVTASFAAKFLRGELDPNTLGRDKGGYGVGTTGLAWAFRRAAFDKVGGLLDRCILGSADWHMAYGLTGYPDAHPQTSELVRCGRTYAGYIKAWQNRASDAIRQNVGCVDGHAIHYFHGSKKLRGYGERWKILQVHDYDPYVDVYPDAQQVLQLSPRKPCLRDDIRRYFKSRVEDSIHLYPGDRPLA